MADTSFRGAVVSAEESVDAGGVDGRRILTQFARDVVPETSLDAHLNVGEVALERADEEPRGSERVVAAAMAPSSRTR
jgi:hypothetical protein